MKLKRYDKRYLPMLFIGLGIWGGAMAAMALMSSPEGTEGQSTLMELGKDIFQKFPVFTLLLLCLFQPVLEEFSFRLWGVGKKWMTIVCLVLMSVFALSEMGLWAFLFIGAFIAVWLTVKDLFKQRWINAVITSACFALCHISGFGSFGWGMVLGLLDIFGMALVMCWLTINLSFWFSCLLHVGNNSLAILLPMIFLPDPVANTYTFDGGIEISTGLRGLNGLKDNVEDIEGANDDDESQVFVMVGEPAEIAVRLLETAKWDSDDFSSGPYYDWVAINENIEERVVYTVRYCSDEQPTANQLLEAFLKDYEAYSERTMTFDTSEAELNDINLIYFDYGDTVNVNRLGLSRSADFGNVVDRVESGSVCRTQYIFAPYAGEEDDTVFYYALTTTREPSMMSDYNAVDDFKYGFRMEFIPTGKKVQLITIH